MKTAKTTIGTITRHSTNRGAKYNLAKIGYKGNGTLKSLRGFVFAKFGEAVANEVALAALSLRVR